MEGLLTGTTQDHVLRSPTKALKRSLSADSESEESRVARRAAKKQRKAEKRKRKEEKAARRAAKAVTEESRSTNRTEQAISAIHHEGTRKPRSKKAKRVQEHQGTGLVTPDSLDNRPLPDDEVLVPATLPAASTMRSPALPITEANLAALRQSTGVPSKEAKRNAIASSSKLPRRNDVVRRSGNEEAKGVADTDEDLREAFRVPGAMDQWLAAQWRPVSELQRLEAAGILRYKRGRFTKLESIALKTHLDAFKRTNRMDDEELSSIIMSKGRSGIRKEYPRFFLELAGQVPGRPVKYVKDYIKRLYDPRARQGAWKKEEDDELLRAYQIHPTEWTKIANIVGRTELDCRDRYKNELIHRDTRQTGTWSLEEMDRLAKYVMEANTVLSRDPIGTEAPWDVIAEKMGGTRTRQQCRKKWQDDLRDREMNNRAETQFRSSDRIPFIRRLKGQNVASEDEVNWTNLNTGSWSSFSPIKLKGAWSRMKRLVSGWEIKTYTEILDALEPILEKSKAKDKQRRRTSKEKGDEADKMRLVSSDSESGGEKEEQIGFFDK